MLTHPKKSGSWHADPRDSPRSAQSCVLPTRRDPLNRGARHQITCRSTYRNRAKRHSCHTHLRARYPNPLGTLLPTSQRHTPANHASADRAPDTPADTRAPSCLRAVHHDASPATRYWFRRNALPSAPSWWSILPRARLVKTCAASRTRPPETRSSRSPRAPASSCFASGRAPPPNLAPGRFAESTPH